MTEIQATIILMIALTCAFILAYQAGKFVEKEKQRREKTKAKSNDKNNM